MLKHTSKMESTLKQQSQEEHDQQYKQLISSHVLYWSVSSSSSPVFYFRQKPIDNIHKKNIKKEKRKKKNSKQYSSLKKEIKKQTEKKSQNGTNANCIN